MEFANKGLLLWAVLLTGFILVGAVPHVFAPGTTISSAEVNANFAQLDRGNMRAFAYILADGTVMTQFNKGGGAITVNHVAASGQYDITIPGLAYTFVEDPTLVSVVDLAARGATIVNAGGGVARVRIWDAAGAAEDCNFQFAVFNR